VLLDGIAVRFPVDRLKQARLKPRVDLL
jgi:hypothetical protein